MVLLLVGVGLGLSQPRPSSPSDASAIVSRLAQESAFQRLQAIHAYAQFQHPDPYLLRALIGTLEHDPNVNVRLAALETLAAFSEHQIVRKGLIDALPRQRSPLVQVELIDVLADLPEQDSEAVLWQLVEDEQTHETVRRHAAQRIESLP